MAILSLLELLGLSDSADNEIMQLDFAFLAQYADYVTDGRMAIFGAGIDGVESSVVPFQAHPMCLVAKFLIAEEDAARSHFYRIEVIGPNGSRKLMLEDQALNTAVEPRGRYPGGSNLIVNLNINFMNIGLYNLCLMLDGEDVKQLPINVSHIPSLETLAKQGEEATNGG